MSKIPFTKLKTNAAKRVRIAKDALAQIAAKKLIAHPGVYIMKREYGDGSLQKWLKTNTCEVCALGAAVCGLTVNNGDFQFNSNGGMGQAHEKLSKYFSVAQMTLIEGCFEGKWVDNGNNPTPWLREVEGAWDDGRENYYNDWTRLPEDDRPFMEYLEKYEDADERLVAVLENIVVNRGTFVFPAELLKSCDNLIDNPDYDWDDIEPT